MSSRAEATTGDRERFLARFCHFGRAPSAATYLALFHPDATLYDDGMEHPIGVAEIPAHIEGVLALVKGFRMIPERWRARGPRVFVEAHNQGEIAGCPVAWRAVYRIELEGDLVRNGRRYFDRAPLLACLGAPVPSVSADLAPRAEARACGARPGTDASPEALVETCARAWREGHPEAIEALFREDAALFAPGLGRALGTGEIAEYFARFAALLRGAKLAPRSLAGDDSLLFIEWEGVVPGRAGPFPFGLVDRFDLQGGRILAARSYYDASALANALG